MLDSINLTDDIVTLRPFQREDVPDLYAAARESIPDVKPWMSWAHDGYSMDEARDFIALTHARWEEGTLFAFAITDAKTGSVLGGISLSHLHPVYHLCNVGYWVRTSRHGEGIAGRATKLAVPFGFEHAGLVRAEVVVAVGNKKSIRVAEKLGAHYEGILRNRMVIGKVVVDAHMYALVPQDFGLEVRL